MRDGKISDLKQEVDEQLSVPPNFPIEILNLCLIYSLPATRLATLILLDIGILLVFTEQHTVKFFIPLSFPS
jgi:hypothetical protein